MGRFKSKLSVLRQVYRLSRFGGMPEPKWLAPCLELNRLGKLSLGPEDTRAARRHRRKQFPEDKYIQSFYDRYPNAPWQPIDLDSFDPPPVKKLALRQLALVEKGMSPKAARQEVEQEMLATGELKIPERPSIIAQIQAEEELALMAAIQEQKQSKLIPSAT